MKKIALAKTLLLALLLLAVVGHQPINLATGQNPLDITIKLDGSIDPAGAPIQRDGNSYILTSDAGGIQVYRSNILLDGNRHALSSTLAATNVANVTIRNFIVTVSNSMDNILLDNCSNITIANNTISRSPSAGSTSLGIDVWGGTSNVITGNIIIDNVNGISLESTTSNNRISSNDIIGNYRGLWIYGSQNNVIYNNNFVNNTIQVFVGGSTPGTSVVNTFDFDAKGNYWSNYNGTDNNHDGIGDTPYIIDDVNRDNYPLMKPVVIPEFPSLAFPLLSLIASMLAMVCWNKRNRKISRFRED